MRRFYKNISKNFFFSLFFFLLLGVSLCIPFSVVHGQTPAPTQAERDEYACLQSRLGAQRVDQIADNNPGPTKEEVAVIAECHAQYNSATPAPTPAPAPATGTTLQGPTPSGEPLDTITTPPPNTTNQFIPLTNLPGLSDDTGKRTLADYINVLYRLAIGIGALLAVIQITVAGIKYMGQDAGFSSKEEAKKDITGALTGLLIMLSTFVILRLIYPDILNLDVLQKLKPVEVVPQTTTTTLPTGASEIPAEARAAAATAAEKKGETLSASLDISTDLVPKTQVQLTNDFKAKCDQVQGRTEFAAAKETSGGITKRFSRIFCFTKGLPASQEEPH